MKPIYLEFCGINSFSEKTQIDFRALLSGGVFGIFGDTGSGKSTILDCIHLALYGVVERASKSMNDCINYGADSAYVVFDFELTSEGKRKEYRVRRERKRKNGTTKAYLYEYDEQGELLALAEGTRDVDNMLEEIIGLSFSDFKMCIALPQGDFAALVKSTTAERVKLVSRLFDLEKYGERLYKAVNEKYFQAEQAVNLVRAEMGQNEGGRDEFIAEKQAEIEEYKNVLEATMYALKNAEKAYEDALALQKEKAAYDEICRKLEEMRLLLPSMEKRRAQLERLPFARLVEEKALLVERNDRDGQTAKEAAVTADKNRITAEKGWEEKKAQLLAGDFDSKIVETSVKLEKVRGAQEDIKRAQDAEMRLQQAIAQYNQLKNKLVKEDFLGQKEELEKELALLGEDASLLEYIKRNCKNVLLADVYLEMRTDLQDLGKKYPIAQTDIGRLVEKYTLAEAGEGQNFDVEQLNFAFKQAEQRKKALKLSLDDLDKRKREYDRIDGEMQLLKTQGGLYRQEYDLAQQKIAFIKDMGTSDVLEKQLSALQKAKADAQRAVDEAQENAQKYHAETEKQKGLLALYEKQAETLSQELAIALQNNGFASVEEARDLIKILDERAQTECKAFFERYELFKHKQEEAHGERFVDFDEGALSAAQEKKQILTAQKDEYNRKLATAEAEYKRLIELREKYKAFEKDLLEKEKRREVCDELRAMLRGNRFLEFIASEYLQEICILAGKTLLSLTNGRYFLQYDKDFKVGDNRDGGNLRAVRTLSGGETFLVSLSLALSLSATICQKSLRPIEFFFLDEGFGTLDGKLVDTVMDVLGKLSKEFSVGLISHVEELKHRIENKILVTGATEKHGSQVRIEGF